MDHVGTMVVDPSFRWVDRVILDLHFDACYFQRDKDPGRWRTGPIGVTAADGSLEYEGPDSDRVASLMDEVVEWLATGDLEVDVVVRAAMAHLHVTSVHPFRDGNGRVSRIVQSLVLAREGPAAPEFFSIEEYLGNHTQEYYAALREAQGGAISHTATRADGSPSALPPTSPRPGSAWRRSKRRPSDGPLWKSWSKIALEQSLVGGTDRGKYGKEADVSPATASADFRRLLDAGLVERRGRGRNINYLASERLREA